MAGERSKQASPAKIGRAIPSYWACHVRAARTLAEGRRRWASGRAHACQVQCGSASAGGAVRAEERSDAQQATGHARNQKQAKQASSGRARTAFRSQGSLLFGFARRVREKRSHRKNETGRDGRRAQRKRPLGKGEATGRGVRAGGHS